MKNINMKKKSKSHFIAILNTFKYGFVFKFVAINVCDVNITILNIYT